MTTAFLDTLYLLALASTDDAYHHAAVAGEREYRGRVLTTEYILLEVLDALTTGAQREIGSALVGAIRRDENCEIISASTALFDRGLRLYEQHRDKQWGITDCISFVVMRDRRLTDALTADHHFEQAGFRALLRT